jgi:hypothetical protein
MSQIISSFENTEGDKMPNLRSTVSRQRMPENFMGIEGRKVNHL